MRPLASLLAFVTLAGGCSFAYVDRYHEPRTATSDLHCTSSYRWPVVDTVLTALATAAVVYASTRPADPEPADSPGSAGAAGFGSLAAVGYGTSAIYGYWHVSTCRAEKQRVE